MCLFECLPVGQVLLLPMGEDSDSYESVTDEEEGHDSPTPPAGVTPKAKAAPVLPAAPPRAPSVPPPTHGAYMRAAKAAELSSSPEVSPAPARRRTEPRYDSDVESSSPPKAASSRPAAAKGTRKWADRGKGDRPTCDICWLPVSPHPSRRDQHRRWNLTCLQWQHWNTGECSSWEDAAQRAVRQKARREARHIRQQAEALGGKAAGLPASRDMPAERAGPEETERHHRPVSPEKKKKKKKKSKGKRRDYSPEVEAPERRRRRRPPTSESEEHRPRRSKRPRQLIINLPAGVHV